ncbi:hypothetical protein [Algoriphagus sp. NG3]|uniref:hypothetical protein n=1 Tax=Algoriphagus sp. NG3 TaxID=3097546 RepID=UPI002A80595B|nr:hypothetical protein [Algoriphagus sp. NG3]WPR75209.1 hypothetical protein SLW71_21340 [Algoriphagus sp. NG3]
MFSYQFTPFLAYSLLVFENNQPTSYSLFHLEQSQALPIAQRIGRGDEVNYTNFYHPSGLKSGTHQTPCDSDILRLVLNKRLLLKEKDGMR